MICAEIMNASFAMAIHVTMATRVRSIHAMALAGVSTRLLQVVVQQCAHRLRTAITAMCAPLILAVVVVSAQPCSLTARVQMEMTARSAIRVLAAHAWGRPCSVPMATLAQWMRAVPADASILILMGSVMTATRVPLTMCALTASAQARS
jgi:hypothetical protein